MIETRRYEFTAEHFVANPDLYRQIAYAWETQQWLSLFGEQPDSPVMATHETNDKGELVKLTLYYRKNRPDG
jgi:hypothetical protein